MILKLYPDIYCVLSFVPDPKDIRPIRFLLSRQRYSDLGLRWERKEVIPDGENHVSGITTVH